MPLIFLLLTLFVCFTACDREKKASREAAPLQVIAVKPEVRELTELLETVGTLHPSKEAKVVPEVSGTIAQLFVKEGDFVDAGKPLLTLDPHLYKNRLIEAEAERKVAEASLEGLGKKQRRFEKLAQKDLIAQTEWDELETQIKKAGAALAISEVRVELAKKDLTRCSLVSPIEGRIGRLGLYPGQPVSAGNTCLATISQMDPLFFECRVTELELPKMDVNQTQVEIAPLCRFGDDCHKAGQITFIDNHFEAKSGQILVKGVIANPDLQLRPGQAVSVQIPIGTAALALLVPQKAVRYNDQGPYVFIVDENHQAALRQLELGDEKGSLVIVKKGIVQDDLVITDGLMKVSIGQQVELQP